MQLAWWAHMHRFVSVCILSVLWNWPKRDKIINISGSIGVFAVYGLCCSVLAVYLRQFMSSVFQVCAYLSQDSVRYTACTGLLTVDCSPLHLYCTLVWARRHYLCLCHI